LRNLICAGLLILPAIAFGKTASLSIGSGYAKAGWTVDLPITLSGGALPNALQWSFGYSSDITSVTVAAGVSTKVAGKTLSCSGTTCIVFGGKNTTLADGVVGIATFQIAAKPSATTIEIVVKNVVAGEVNGSIPASGGSGRITLPTRASLTKPSGEVLKTILQPADEFCMERRLHPRTQVQFETKVTSLKARQESCLGRTCDISGSGISVVQALELAPGDLVQLEMADSVATGRVVYSNPEGAQFRVGIEVQKVQLGDSPLSILLQRTLMETMPLVPGVEYAERS
jgi:PilZ domain